MYAEVHGPEMLGRRSGVTAGETAPTGGRASVKRAFTKMGKINSRSKGARGERMWRDELRAAGFTARRGQQFAGGTDSPDVICSELAGLHQEVKFVESLNLENACTQAERDAGGKPWIVAHKKSRTGWKVTMGAETFFALLREGVGAFLPKQF